MDNARSFFDASIPEPYVILNIELKPFSLGHRLILEWAESSFLTNKKTTVEDLLFAVFICGQTYEDGVASMWSDWRTGWMERWGKMLMKPTWLHRVGIRKTVIPDFQKSAEVFVEYLLRYCQVPGFTYDPSRSRAVCAPLVQVIKLSLLRNTNLSETEILNRPWGLCQWDHMMLKSQDGAVTLVEEDVLAEAQAVADQLQEELDRGKNSNTKD